MLLPSISSLFRLTPDPIQPILPGRGANPDMTSDVAPMRALGNVTPQQNAYQTTAPPGLTSGLQPALAAFLATSDPAPRTLTSDGWDNWAEQQVSTLINPVADDPGIAVPEAPAATRWREAVSRFDPVPADTPDQSISAAPLTGFVQINEDGFGDPMNVYAWSMKSFGGYLYAGTGNLAGVDDSLSGSAELWRYDGADWEQITDTGFGNANNTGIRNLVEFRGDLYAAMVNQQDGAEIWRSSNGTDWEQVASGGLYDTGNEAVRALVEFKGRLYAGLQDTSGGTGELWRAFDGDRWLPIARDGFGWPSNSSVHDLTVFNGYLYAGIRNTTSGAQIWRSENGKDWDQVVGRFGDTPKGFGDTDTVLVFDFQEFNGQLYVSTANVVDGFALFRTTDGLNYEQIGDFGFGDPSNGYGWRMHVFEGALWLGVTNIEAPEKGASLYRSFDGVNFEEMIGANGTYGDYGFDNPINWGVRSFETYEGELYIGTANCPFGDCADQVTGAQIYQWTGDDMVATAPVDSFDFI
jgi:hypothetical protein